MHNTPPSSSQSLPPSRPPSLPPSSLKSSTCGGLSVGEHRGMDAFKGGADLGEGEGRREGRREGGIHESLRTYRLQGGKEEWKGEGEWIDE